MSQAAAMSGALDPAVPGRRASARSAFRIYAGLAAAVALGALCRFWDLGGHSLFIDEGYVFHVIDRPVHDILLMVAYADFHPPLFYLVAHYLVAWLRWPLWDYRYLTAGFSLLGIAATWAIARRFFGVAAANIAGLALALEPAIIEWDRLFRMYSVFVALAAVSWWLLVRAHDARGRARWMWWMGYLVTALALPYTHYMGAFILLSQGLYAVFHLRELWPALVCDAAAAVALVPWLWAVKVQYPNGGYVVPLASSAMTWSHVVRPTLVTGIPPNWLLAPAFDPAFSIFVLAILFFGGWVARRSIVPFWLFPLTFNVGASLATGKDLLIPRYLYGYVPAFCIALGAACSYLLATKYRLAGVAAAAAYFTFSAVGVPNLLFVPYYQFPDWYQVNALLLANERKNDLIVLDQGAEFWVVYRFSGFAGHELDAPALPRDVPVTIRWLAGYPKRRIWYIENQPEFTDAGRRIKGYLDATRTPLKRWRQNRIYSEDVVRITLYGPRLAAGRHKSVVKITSP